MSKVKNPREKKRLAYLRDHYNRGGEHNKGWRKAKPLKKAKARRSYRKEANALAQDQVAESTSPTAATRKREGMRQRNVYDWGAIALKEFVVSRSSRRKASVGAKKRRRARSAIQRGGA